MQRIVFYILFFGLGACSQPNIEQKISQQTFSSIAKVTSMVWHENQKLALTKIPSKPYLDWQSDLNNQHNIKRYKAFLRRNNVDDIIPDFELFQTARDWQKCHAEAFEVPPQEMWPNIIPTLKILKQLLDQKILDDFTVTSVYRNFNLNRCANGADRSKHVFNAALDFRISSLHPSPSEQLMIQQSKNKLCQFWKENGASLNMGLDIYASGQIHIDSAGYRTWGKDHRSRSSPCLRIQLSP